MSGVITKVMKLGALVIVGLGVGSIIDLIKSDTKAGIKKCPLDSKTKKKLETTQDALKKMNSNYTIFCFSSNNNITITTQYMNNFFQLLIVYTCSHKQVARNYQCQNKNIVRSLKIS